jgi:N-acetylglucosamine-6-phosphate deacetylase
VDREEATAFMDTGVVRLIALAPEYPESHWLIKEATSRGIVVSAAHTEAGPDELAAAVSLGLSQVTHMYNAMTGLNHRNPGTVGAAMVSDKLHCELIADGTHVCPIAMDVLIRTKGLERVIVITDAVSQAGLPEGEYDMGGRKVIVGQDRIQLPDGTLAGASSMMDRNLRQIMEAARLSLSQAMPLMSLNAARQLRIEDRKGKLVPGYDADIVLLNSDHEATMTLVQGRIVFKSSSSNVRVREPGM